MKKEKKAVILQSSYLPWRGYFDLIHDADVFCFYDEVKYTKNDWRNRNRICPKSGPHWITVPIDKDAVKLKISEVELKDALWQEKHFKSLHLAYKNAPHFDQMEELLIDLYKEKEWNSLAEFNQYAVRQICIFLNIETQIVNSKDYNLKDDRLDRLLGLLLQLGTTEYISGPSAKNYLNGNEHLFSSNNIKLTFKDYSGYPAYKQFKEPFESAVSVLDLIAHVKKEEIPDYIWKWRK